MAAQYVADWNYLVMHLGSSINEVRTMVETSLTDMILKTFDPKKADTIFSEEGEVRKMTKILYILILIIIYFVNVFRHLVG